MKYRVLSELLIIFVLVINIRAAIIILSVISIFLIMSIDEIEDIIIVDGGIEYRDIVAIMSSRKVLSHHKELLRRFLVINTMIIMVNNGSIIINIYFLWSLILNLFLLIVRLLLIGSVLGLPHKLP